MADISFYRERDHDGYMSNFYPAPIFLDGKDYPTTEHYFQAMKFADSEALVEKIRKQPSPGQAARLGRSRSLPLRGDWESVKDNVMRKALFAKFTQHPRLKTMLMKTHPRRLVEHTKNDAYWGDGGDGSGKNMLGFLLMELREALSERTTTL